MASQKEVLERLHPGLRRWVQGKGWKGLTPIQLAAIPVLVGGRDAVVEAPTAGGKTEAVLFPSLSRAAAMGGKGVLVLYLAPLRALLNNLELRGEDYAQACSLHAFKWHGDVSQQAKLEQLRCPPQLLLTTPESLEAILLRKAEAGEMFRNLRTVIVDEAHNFAAGDRGGHLLCLLERLERLVETPPQRIALTATLGNPETMARWLAGGREAAQLIRVAGARPERDFKICFFRKADDKDEEGEENAAQRAHRALYELLPGWRSLVFVRSRRGAEAIAMDLNVLDAGRGRPLRVRTHHSAVSRYYREEAEQLIQCRSEQGLDAILSTATLELGIDIGELDRVIQMGALASPGALLQRVGRTGRRPGKPQFLRGLVDDEADLPILVATVTLALERRSEELRFPQRAFHLLAHQLLCLSLQHRGIDARRAWELLRPAHCFRGIRASEVGELVAHMIAQGFLRSADGLVVPGERSEKKFLRWNWRRLFAVFDSAPLYDVVHGRQQVGTLDMAFAVTLEAPCLLVLAGHLWRADRIDHEERVVEVSPAKAGAVPNWVSFGGPPVPFETARRAGALLHGQAEMPAFLDAAAYTAMEKLKRQASSVAWQPGVLALDLSAPRKPRILTYAGDRINRTLAAVLALEGLDPTSPSYASVQVSSRSRDPEALLSAIESVFTGLRGGERGNPDRLAAELLPGVPEIPFSPFACCLPPELHAAALMEQIYDVEGLVSLVRELSF